MSDHTFERERARLRGLAYRMLGEVSAAEDVVQEAWIRWNQAQGVRNPAAWLNTVVTRLCLDELGSARSRRETYVGPWLPEPLPTDEPAQPGEMAESLSMAFLVLLEHLTPPQRAAFLLRDVFDYDMAEVAEILGTSADNARQLASRARRHVQQGRPRFDAPGPAVDALVMRFGVACLTGDLEGLVQSLSEDATLWSDGGGVVHAAARPIRGPKYIAKFLLGIVRIRGAMTPPKMMWVNGQPGAIFFEDGRVESALVLDISDSKVVGVRIVRNPNKLTHLAAQPTPAD
ncbi:MAG: RNA polymerase sigma-70 factor [Myxococcota bacterium]